MVSTIALQHLIGAAGAAVAAAGAAAGAVFCLGDLRF